VQCHCQLCYTLVLSRLSRLQSLHAAMTPLGSKSARSDNAEHSIVVAERSCVEKLSTRTGQSTFFARPFFSFFFCKHRRE
jgi:hypothetical protein